MIKSVANILTFPSEMDGEPGPTFNLKNNGRKKLLFLGKTGSGKSALCNALSVPIEETDEFFEKKFPECADIGIGNTSSVLSNVDYLGQPEKEVSFIDTVGFDSTKMSNTKIAEFIVKLKECCDFINLCAVVLNAPKRIEDSLKDTIVLLVNMFGKEWFWKNVVFIISNLQQSDKQVEKRKRRSMDDKRLISSLCDQLREDFELETALNPPIIIIDAHCDMAEEDERVRFEEKANALYDMLMDPNRTAMPVNSIEKVACKYEGLQEAINKAEEDNDKLRKKVKELETERDNNLKAMKRAEAEAASYKEKEAKAREKAAQLQEKAENAEKNADRKESEHLRQEVERVKQDIKKFEAERKKAEQEAADCRWKYYLACASLVTLAAGGAAALYFSGGTLAALVGAGEVEAIKIFIATQVAPHVAPILVAFLKRRCNLDL